MCPECTLHLQKSAEVQQFPDLGGPEVSLAQIPGTLGISKVGFRRWGAPQSQIRLCIVPLVLRSFFTSVFLATPQKMVSPGSCLVKNPPQARGAPQLSEFKSLPLVSCVPGFSPGLGRGGQATPPHTIGQKRRRPTKMNDQTTPTSERTYKTTPTNSGQHLGHAP